jgi:hypothetical protein
MNRSMTNHTPQKFVSLGNLFFFMLTFISIMATLNMMGTFS